MSAKSGKSQNLALFPNIKRVKIFKNVGEDNYTVIDNVELFVAMQTLSPAAFKLWLHFCTNKPGYTFWLYPGKVEKETGLKGSTYHRAVRELKSNGYIIEKPGKISVIEFHSRSDYFNYDDIYINFQESREYKIDDEFEDFELFDSIPLDIIEEVKKVEKEENKKEEEPPKEEKKETEEKPDVSLEETLFAFFDEI